MRQFFGDATERADEDDRAVYFSRSFIALLEGGIKVRITASCYRCRIIPQITSHQLLHAEDSIGV
jgi:hypothetical protein